MAYTIGIKRRFLPGYRKVQVKGHDWQNGRFILNLTDGSQLHIPGFQTPDVKVYPDFWTHLQFERASAAPVIRQGATQRQFEERPAPAPVAVQNEPVQQPLFDPLTDEVKRRAAERVRSILASDASP